jgi:hypothetical protein
MEHGFIFNVDGVHYDFDIDVLDLENKKVAR